MLGTTFYHGTVRKITVAFGTLFNNIHIQRKDRKGNLEQDIIVPISYETKEKFIARLIQSHHIDDKPDVRTIIPRIGFVMNGMSFDEDRKLNTMNEWRHQDIDSNGDVFRDMVRSPMPYNFDFTVDIYTKHIDDALQIIEQILPYFHPDFNITIKDIPELDVVKDVPVILNSVSSDVQSEGPLVDRRIVNWTLEFTVKGYIYPPSRLKGKVIRKVMNSMYASSGHRLRDSFNGIENVNVIVDPLGTCSDTQYTSKATCEAASETWTPTNEDDNWEPKVIIE